MASTPSASALSAVLRCQGNILARKQANKKRPPASVYGLGMTCGDSVRSSFRSLWGFIFHRERVEIPGVLSATARFETGCSGKSSRRNGESKDLLLKSSLKTDNKMLTMKVSSEPNQWPKTKLTSDNTFAFKSQRYPKAVLSKNSLVLRLDGTYLRKLNSEYPWTCICVVCARSKSTLNHSNVNPLFSLGLLWILKNKLIYITTAVSDSVRELGIGWNQLHPDFDKCVKCTSEHHEDQDTGRS
ncbi:uncharacterized protein LOC107683376 [Sinocyclocheilus anshuiensis]|uniref:uncharacterized protein LOC107683376 n=1 Tax=Sinocyclocheilus anshuiensis TaxID=1608454 RepID=UPI0007B9E7DD|nr:PREDICTED: uncharacterized protein LOC107683376 [Sinocyclocheilus anshuiensis]